MNFVQIFVDTKCYHIQIVYWITKSFGCYHGRARNWNIWNECENETIEYCHRVPGAHNRSLTILTFRAEVCFSESLAKKRKFYLNFLWKIIEFQFDFYSF